MNTSPELPTNIIKQLRSLIWLCALNTIIAIFITVMMGGVAEFHVTWFVSMLIGFSIKGTIDLLQWLIWRNNPLPRAGLLLICVIGAPIGYYVGSVIGNLIIGGKLLKFTLLFSNGNQVFVVMSVFISLFAGTFLWSQSKIAQVEAQREKEKARAAEVEKQAMQAQLQLLQAQIEPHMLFNTLANLQGLIAIDTPRAQHMLEQLIRYLRASLRSSRVQQTTLQHEFDLLEAYLELIAVRMGKRLRYSIDLPSELAQHNIAPMLLQPLVENAIKHGLEPKVDGGSIYVEAKLVTTHLQLTVSDTGLGLDANYDPKHISQDSQSHVGNANIRDRLLALYGADARLDLEANEPEGVIARITLPYSQTM